MRLRYTSTESLVLRFFFVPRSGVIPGKYFVDHFRQNPSEILLRHYSVLTNRCLGGSGNFVTAGLVLCSRILSDLYRVLFLRLQRLQILRCLQRFHYFRFWRIFSGIFVTGRLVTSSDRRISCGNISGLVFCSDCGFFAEKSAEFS